MRILKMSNFVLRRLEEARVTYQKVLELDSRYSIALGFLGLVYHLMGNLDKAIVKYHEVRSPSHCQLNLILFPQALSVDPINPHILELLNTALESSVTRPSFKVADADWNRAVRTLRFKYTTRQDKGKERAHADVLPLNDIGSAPDEMNIG